MAQSKYFSVDTVRFEGVESDNPFAYRHFNAEAVIGGKTMLEHLRPSLCYWHTICNPLSDPFGPGTARRPWDEGRSGIELAKARIPAFFELLSILGVRFYCFHDRDIAPEGATLAETNKNLDIIVKELRDKQQLFGVSPLWGTANLFSNPRYMHGAGTSPSLDVFIYAAAQVKKALEVTHELGGKGYVFWGGREGYQTLWNTDMRRELDHLASLLRMAHEYAQSIGFKGQFYIEPKPKEPTKHQYDSDAAACLNFLRQYNLMEILKLNLETNHATLAGHTMHHELEVAGAAGALGSVDANCGDIMLGWDTDHFPHNVYDTMAVMWTVLKYGGFTTGGLNFDAKVRRESPEPDDLIHAHILGLDTFAWGLKAAFILRDMLGESGFHSHRYDSWDSSLGRTIESDQCDLVRLAEIAGNREVEPLPSGKEEHLHTVINQALVLANK